MEVKISKIDIGGVLTLPPNWKGYSFNEDTDSWIKDSDLYKDKKGSLHPFCSMVSTSNIAKIFETCPINDNNILIIRGDINDIFVIAYVLVGSSDIENHTLETKLLLN
ncbi:hypothetical protein KAW18_03820 [candidate division WOR-3 bacterium]|nr:hypothetical protein [Candidatus Parcubacteria bacterium]MCK4526475.1 hypothetical protein [candidate division WOR-3 bacterium]